MEEQKAASRASEFYVDRRTYIVLVKGRATHLDHSYRSRSDLSAMTAFPAFFIPLAA